MLPGVRAVQLRPYQLDLLARLRASTARSVLVQLPTGGGKSVLIRELAENRVLVLAHAEWLIDQLHDLVGGQALKAGAQYDGSRRVVGMVQTVARRDLPAPDTIIVDEAHHTPSPTYRAILARYPEARVIGFTATPQRLDGGGLPFDELLCGPSYRELIDGGFLKPFEVLSIPSGVEMAGAHTRAGEFAAEDVKQAVRRSTVFGDVVEHYVRHCRTLGGHASFWPSIEMAEEAAARFTARGIRCAPLHSKMPRENVRALIAGLRRGVIDSLASVGMIGEGLDVPGLSSVSLCRPTQSLTVYLQQAGRCNRGGAGIARVMDHVANWQRHGLPDDDRKWSLAGRQRRGAAAVLPVWTCPECWGVNRSTSGVCSRCGGPKPRVLVEMEEQAAELEVIRRTVSVGELDSPAQYRKFAELNGKSLAWAALQWCQRGAKDNPFLVAAEGYRPSRAEFLRAASELGLTEPHAREAAKMMRLRY